MVRMKSGEDLGKLEGYFVALSVFLSLVSFFGLTLLCLGRFTPIAVGVGALVASVLTAVLTRGVRRGGTLGRTAILLVGITVLGLLLRLNVSPYVYGGQDPGVYFNVASHFAQNGTFVIKDNLLDELTDNPELRQYYIERSIRHVHRYPDGTWYGNLVAGTYLRDFDKNEWLPQFYFLNPLWLAIGQWIFGVEWQGLVIAFFSALTVLGGALVTRRLSRSSGATFLAAALLATNSTLAYFGTAPVSEGIAAFFFMGGLALLVMRRHFLSILPFGALFFARITGFITLPLLLVALLWILIKRRERAVLGAGIGYVAMYGVSVCWGLTYSPYYSSGIYNGKLGIPGPMLAYAGEFFVVLALGWVILGALLLAAPRFSRALARRAYRYGVGAAAMLLAVVITSALYRGYLLGFTDTFIGHRWFDSRWKMVGLGLKSMEFLSLHTLAVMLSYGGAAAFLLGLIVVGKVGVRRAVVSPVPILAAGFLAVFSVYPLATPYLYYFGRYLASELLPLGIICGAVAVDTLALSIARRGPVIRWVYFSVVFLSLLPSFTTRLSLREGKEFYDFVACLDRVATGRSLFLIEKKGVPETPLVTPLRFTYQKPTFMMSFKDFSTVASRRALVEYFRAKGFRVFLLSAHDRRSMIPGLTLVGRVVGKFRTIGGKRGQPRRIRERSHSVMVLSANGEVALPPGCPVKSR